MTDHAISITRCGCPCPCHADEAKPEWPGPCEACCTPEWGPLCECIRAIAMGGLDCIHARADTPLREALAFIRGIASGEQGDEASRTDPWNALGTIVIECDRIAALTPTADAPSEYGRLLAERDRLIAAGVDPADLDLPDAPTADTHPGGRPMTDPLTDLLDGIRDEVCEAVLEGDAQDCSSADCIADAVYEIIRVRLRAAGVTLAAPAEGLDVERLLDPLRYDGMVSDPWQHGWNAALSAAKRVIAREYAALEADR